LVLIFSYLPLEQQRELTLFSKRYYKALETRIQRVAIRHHGCFRSMIAGFFGKFQFKYEGAFIFKNGECIAHGAGKRETTDGGVLMGEFRDGKKDGLVKQTHQTGAIELKEMKADRQQGYYFGKDKDGDEVSCYYWQVRKHGLCYAKYTDGKEDYMLFENGCWRRRFTDAEVQQVKAGTLDWTTFFQSSVSEINMTANQTFDGPSDWSERVNKMEQRVEKSVGLAIQLQAQLGEHLNSFAAIKQ
jgi:hypothetical protein